VNDPVLRAEDARNLVRVVYKFRWSLTQLFTPTQTHIFSNHSSGYSRLNAVTCGVQRIVIKQNRKRFEFGFGQQRDYNF
jgi:hypothetical protein